MNNDRDDGCWCRGEGILNVCTMPGANCCLPQCTKSGYKRKIPLPEENEDEKIHFFQITTRKSKFYTEWRDKVIHIIKRHREDIDADFITQLMKGNKWICSRHYRKEDIKFDGE